MRRTPIVTVWRLVLETASPLSIATGRGDGERDTVLASDANGLPFIPASSMAGVLRALVRAAEPALEGSLFGHLAASDTELGHMSRLEISHAHVHDSHDRPVTGLCECVEDALLQPLLHRRNAQRQRVRINHRGTADDGGLFDRSMLPAGHRFSVEWVLWSLAEHPPEARLLEALLAQGWLRLGGLTRSGFGLLRAVRGHTRCFDLRRSEDLAAWSALPADLAAPAEHVLTTPWTPGGSPGTASEPSLGGLRKLRLTLSPEGGFRFGGGTQSLREQADSHPNADWAASERRVVWESGRGQLQALPQAVVPATGVKGALAHRVAFHAHRLGGEWASSERLLDYDKAVHCPTVRRLFGNAGDDREATQAGQARAGVLGFADQWLAVSAQAPQARQPNQVTPRLRMHNHIDRFTGGVRDGLLFASEDLYPCDASRPLFTLDITLDEPRWRAAGGESQDLQALALAVDDLCSGRLALGADSAGGLGFFHGQSAWDTGFDWPSQNGVLGQADHTLEVLHE